MPCRPTPCSARRTCWVHWPSGSCWPRCRQRSSAAPNGAASSSCSNSARPPGASRSWPCPSARRVFCCYYRADLLEKLGRRPPQTWAEYEELARLLAASKFSGRRHAGPGPWCGAIEPLSPRLGWPDAHGPGRGLTVKHRDNYSALFNIETMEPLMSGPPWVQALDELAAAAKLGPADPLRYDPAAARAAFWRGSAAWPSPGPPPLTKGERGRGKGESEKSRTQWIHDIRVGFAELPGAPPRLQPQRPRLGQPGEDDDPRVPLLAVAGRLGVVAAKSAHADAAFQLLLWLSDEPHESASRAPPARPRRSSASRT